MPVITVNQVSHTYERFGDQAAPALIFVHGWLLSRHYWQPVVQQLADQFQCITYDLRGFGESLETAMNESGAEDCDRNYTLQAYAEDLSGLLDQLNITNAWIIGHSLGGSVAIWAAHLDPERIQGVICINAGGGIYLKDEFEKFRAVGQQLVKFRPRWLSQLPLIDWVFARDSVARPVARRWGRQRLIDFVKADAAAARGALLTSTTEEEVHRLPQIVAGLEQPLHFIAGAQDTVMEPQYVRHLASFHPSFQQQAANVTELDNCGHLSMIEQPLLVVQTIRSVVQQHQQSEQQSNTLSA
ncbi:MAG: alpha/beta fold hydrolase [Thainema sp.]